VDEVPVIGPGVPLRKKIPHFRRQERQRIRQSSGRMKSGPLCHLSLRACLQSTSRAGRGREAPTYLLARPERGVKVTAHQLAVAHHLTRGVDAKGDAANPAQRAEIGHHTLRPEKPWYCPTAVVLKPTTWPAGLMPLAPLERYDPRPHAPWPTSAVTITRHGATSPTPA
jgi:hypothetical protein